MPAVLLLIVLLLRELLSMRLLAGVTVQLRGRLSHA